MGLFLDIFLNFVLDAGSGPLKRPLQGLRGLLSLKVGSCRTHICSGSLKRLPFRLKFAPEMMIIACLSLNVFAHNPHFAWAKIAQPPPQTCLPRARACFAGLCEHTKRFRILGYLSCVSTFFKCCHFTSCLGLEIRTSNYL